MHMDMKYVLLGFAAFGAIGLTACQATDSAPDIKLADKPEVLAPISSVTVKTSAGNMAAQSSGDSLTHSKLEKTAPAHINVTAAEEPNHQRITDKLHDELKDQTHYGKTAEVEAAIMAAAQDPLKSSVKIEPTPPVSPPPVSTPPVSTLTVSAPPIPAPLTNAAVSPQNADVISAETVTVTPVDRVVTQVDVPVNPDAAVNIEPVSQSVEQAVPQLQEQDAVSAQKLAVAPTWIMEAANSHLKFSALQEGEPFSGAFTSFTADIAFSPDALEKSSVRVSVPIISADAGTADRNSTLPGKVWFSVKKFPEAVYTANSFIALGENSYEAQGELSMKGISKPLTLPFTLDIDGTQAVMNSTLEINRTDWDIGAAPWNTDEWVSTAVTLDIKITANAQ